MCSLLSFYHESKPPPNWASNSSYSKNSLSLPLQDMFSLSLCIYKKWTREKHICFPVSLALAYISTWRKKKRQCSLSPLALVFLFSLFLSPAHQKNEKRKHRCFLSLSHSLSSLAYIEFKERKHMCSLSLWYK